MRRPPWYVTWAGPILVVIWLVMCAGFLALGLIAL